ncbi:Glycosyltransferase involved in cell wall bisynthesis [Succiniclasticum ruminis]|uniref:Glycosyltransferase involved in cell wall bisynthesis n=1 Tax=Succiniclasticum ruminis TaxID=40841 RepID=A0A1G6HS32_9FIRM|nr:glycosyltransferase [Succiniclasticum ruminis]SDB96685.1 Glycosyltransferase involved in cell wall bisynthesis [Succiniclasticum ruminis]
MRVLMINVCCGIKSTGRLCTDLANALIKQGHEVKIAYARGIVLREFQHLSVKIGSSYDVYKQALLARVLDNEGFGNNNATNSFIEWIKSFKPDIIHLHNIHGYYINCESLFTFLKEYKKPVIWTLHDCWSFTGHCTYFDFVNCNRWLTGCFKCPQKKEYPVSIVFDRSRINYIKKKEAFSNLDSLTLITPSYWLAKYVSQSFLRDYPVEVIPNGINTEIFRPTKNNIKEKLGIVNKTMLLGVASIWNKRKGLNVFLDLSKILNENYAIVLIGLTKKQILNLPKGIYGIEFTNGIQELAGYYSAADFFLNPTFEDNYPTTNLEAIACGTPVITFNTGGSVESAALYGFVTKDKTADAIYELLIKKELPHHKPDRKLLDISTCVEKYIKVYNNINKKHVF